MKLARRLLLQAAAAAALPVVAQAEPSAKQLAQGTRWQTPCHTIDSGLPGPTIMIVAGIHGNELAPPSAAQRLLAWRPLRGRLVVVPEANKPALAVRSRFSPKAAFGDLNRNFPVAHRRQPRGAMAAALWAETIALKPDWVVDLHEGWGYRASSASMGSSIVHVDETTEPKAETLRTVINATIDDPRKRFRLIRPGPEGSYARSVSERLGIKSLVFETTWVQPMDLRVKQQLLLVASLLQSASVLAAS